MGYDTDVRGWMNSLRLTLAQAAGSVRVATAPNKTTNIIRTRSINAGFSRCVLIFFMVPGAFRE